MKILTSRLVLTLISADDIPDIHALHRIPETDRYNTLGIPDTIEETEQLITEWIQLGKTEPCSKYTFRIALEHGAFIGLLGINVGRVKYQSAELWYKLRPEYWNQGYATETVRAALQFCFEHLALHRIEAGCAVGNIASARVMEKVGMVHEGRKRKILPIRGEWLDAHLYAILEEDYRLLNSQVQNNYPMN